MAVQLPVLVTTEAVGEVSIEISLHGTILAKSFESLINPPLILVAQELTTQLDLHGVSVLAINTNQPLLILFFIPTKYKNSPSPLEVHKPLTSLLRLGSAGIADIIPSLINIAKLLVPVALLAPEFTSGHLPV